MSEHNEIGLAPTEPVPSEKQNAPLWVTLLQVVLLVVLIGIRYAEPVGDGDLFWQMAYGKYMLAHHTLIPDHTIYSWTPADNPYIYCSWVAEISLYLMHQLGGLPLLFAFRYSMIGLTVGLLFLFARRVGWHRRAEFWLMATWFISASYVGTILKPELFSLGFMSAQAYLLFRFRLAVDRGEKFRPYLVGLVVVMAAWANTHGVFFFGLTALVVYAAGELLNLLFSPGLALKPEARLPFWLALVGCGLAAFLTPYHYHFVLQLFYEGLSIVGGSQSAGDKAAYQSLAAHLPIWKALAFHFHQYMALAVVLAGVLCVWLGFFGPARGKVDFVFLALNLWFGLIFTVYLRSTFYWPPYFLYSSLYLIHVLRGNPRVGPAWSQLNSVLDFCFVTGSMAALIAYFGYIEELAGWFRSDPVESVKWLTLGGIFGLAGTSVLYTAWRLSGGQGAGFLEPRHWLTALAVVAQVFLCVKSSQEAIQKPYAASWCGFGITYWNPVDEVEFLKKYHPGIKTIINDYDSGGYLIWKLFPETKVMIDPRSFPYRKFWADYIAYEHGQLGLEFLERFPDKPEVSLVSLKNTSLWRSYLKDPKKEWVPGWIGTAYVIFVRRGFTYPKDAAEFMPHRFETLRNAQKAFQLYQFGMESNLYETSWAVLEVMKTRFNSTPEEKRMVANLQAYKDTIVNLQHKNLDTAIQAQEKCLEYGQFFNAGLLLEMYKLRLARLKKEGKNETDPLYRETLERAQNLIQMANSRS
ncbi:MAG: hypothetical protein KF760_12385 [Candidatus Eremiobacteraeota bacterium]|nr:hypothetical protein [Candidatus Eremiobacteraeota bacterium]MCW5871721.1 hypothetical protein [Candidatus Eremiobacteraeota bacterium]